MIRPDVIISWPRDTDYPLWRQYIRDNRTRFNQIHIIFTETHHGFDYRSFVREAMFEDWCLFIDSPLPQGKEDWRNIAVNEGLRHSIHAEWLLFTEQDFLPLDGFWDYVDKVIDDGVDVVGVMDETRLHPCFLLMKRSVLNQTTKDFGIVPDKLDHFGRIQKDIEKIGVKVAIVDKSLYHHMNGLSHNFRLISDGENPNYKKEEFDLYLNKCLLVKVPQNPNFNEVLSRYINRV